VIEAVMLLTRIQQVINLFLFPKVLAHIPLKAKLPFENAVMSEGSSSSSVWGRGLPTECTAAFRDVLY
jgi:hypothetical protein